MSDRAFWKWAVVLIAIAGATTFGLHFASPEVQKAAAKATYVMAVTAILTAFAFVIYKAATY